MSKSKKKLFSAFCVLILVTIAALFIAAYCWNLLPQKTYSNADFNIMTITSPVDYNGNGIDDYTDILFGAKQDAENRPVYNGQYYDGGYPPDDIGVCTDVIWRGFKAAGYSLRDMIDRDAATYPEDYPGIEHRDNNIDFRRVDNLHVFFKKYAVSLSIDTNDIQCWQPGDIVIFDDDQHIGIISDLRSQDGTPYIIHNAGQPRREENYLKRTSMTITGHYRFDASQIDPEVLVSWEK
jgi:uncharacterized protein YijF (DUF1287 family)